MRLRLYNRMMHSSVPAGQLKEGDRVVVTGGKVEVPTSVQPHDGEEPTEVFELAFRADEPIEVGGCPGGTGPKGCANASTETRVIPRSS